MDIVIIYTVGILGWSFFWFFFVGDWAFKSIRSLWVPFVLCLFFLVLNLFISGFNGVVAHIELEEGLFNVLENRASLAIDATASVLIVATIIYGVSIKELPSLFIILVSSAFVCLIGLMVPVTWIPTDSPRMLFILRHCQTVPFLWGVFLCVSGIMVILDDIVRVFGKKHKLTDIENDEDPSISD